MSYNGPLLEVVSKLDLTGFACGHCGEVWQKHVPPNEKCPFDSTVFCMKFVKGTTGPATVVYRGGNKQFEDAATRHILGRQEAWPKERKDVEDHDYDTCPICATGGTGFAAYAQSDEDEP